MQEGLALAITSHLVDVNESDIVATHKVTGRVGEPVFGLVDHLTVKIKSDLSLPGLASDEDDPHVADVTSHSPLAYAHYLEGLNFAQKMFVSEAIASFEACLEIDSTYAMAYYHLAGLKDPRLISKAVQNIDRASQRGQHFIRSRESEYLYGCLNHSAILEALLDRFPGEKEAILHQGQHAYLTGDFTEAIKLHKQVLVLDPLSKPAYNFLSYVYDAAGEQDLALEALDNYIRIAPDEPNPYDSRGDLYARHGRIDEAIASYQMALAKKPDFVPSQKNLGHMYLFKGDYDRAMEKYLSLSLNRGSISFLETQQYRTYALMRQGRLAEALVVIDSVIAGYQELSRTQDFFEPTNPHHIKALIYHELGQIEKAVVEIETCIHLINMARPGNAMNYRWVLGQYLAESGDDARVDSVLRAINEYYLESGAPPMQYYRTSGAVALARHEGDRAAELLLRALSGVTPAMDYLTHARLGQAYLEAGRYEEAIATLSQVVTVCIEWRLLDGITSVKSHYYLGQAHEGAGQFALAREQYRIFLDIWQKADSDLIAIGEAKERLARLEHGS